MWIECLNKSIIVEITEMSQIHADYWGQCKRISFMVTGILKRIEPIKRRYAHLVGDAFRQGGQARDALDRLWDVAFRMLRTDDMRYAYQNASQAVADRFFTMWQKQIGEPPGVRPDGAPYTMPVNSSEKERVSQFLQKKGMGLDAQNRVYPCRTIDWRVANMLCKSSYYKKVEVAYEQLAGNVPTDSAEVIAAKKAFDDALKVLQALTT